MSVVQQLLAAIEAEDPRGDLMVLDHAEQLLLLAAEYSLRALARDLGAPRCDDARRR